MAAVRYFYLICFERNISKTLLPTSNVRKRFPIIISKEPWKVFNAIINCGTKELGYHICTCEDCGEEYFGYNSCRNRHCPMCQKYAREKWIQKESSYLLDSKYFHIITTVPYELNEIFLFNQKICYTILFKATSESILKLAEDPKWLGAKVVV